MNTGMLAGTARQVTRSLKGAKDLAKLSVVVNTPQENCNKSSAIGFSTEQQVRFNSVRASAKIGGVEGILTTFNERVNADIVNETQAIYQFNILRGNNKEIYHLDLRNGSGSSGAGKSHANPDTIFSIDAESFNRFVSGNLKAPSSPKSGILKISGSMLKAMELEKLFVALMANK